MRFVEHAAWAGLDAHASFFRDHVAFRVVLTEDGVQQTVGLEREPQFCPIGGQFHEVNGGPVGRGRVQSLGARTRENSVELIGLDEDAGAVFQFTDQLVQAAHGRGIAR